MIHIEKNILRLAYCLAIIMLTSSSVLAQQVNTPNIVFILADDLGHGDLSSYGATKVQTPEIDKLAEEGIRFTEAYSPSSVCTPSRYSLMTGRYAWRTWNGHKTIWADDPLLIDTSRVTLPKLLNSAGYKTAIIGKWHLGFGAPGEPGWDDQKGPNYNGKLKPGPLEVGFDYFYGIPHVGQKPHVYIENHYVVGIDSTNPIQLVLDDSWKRQFSFTNRLGTPRHDFIGGKGAKYEHADLAVHLTNKAVDWIEKQEQEPFFLYFAHRNVHEPHIPNPRFKGTSDIGRYGDFINELDWSVGQILKALDRKGLSDNTIVFFSSDNGAVKDYQPSKRIEYQGHRPNGSFFGQKGEVYEGGVHVPLLVKWPGVIKPGSTSDQLVALNDILATCADLLGEKLPENSGEDSYSFLHALKGKQPRKGARKSVVVDSWEGLLGIRVGPWKLITGQGGGGIVGWSRNNFDPAKPIGQLYNLKKDPGETNNLYNEKKEVVKRLRLKLQKIQYYR